MVNGETLDLSGFYVVFTSNIAAAEMLELQHSTFATMERHVLARAQQVMRPELYARINEKLVFQRLSYDVQLEIARLMLDAELEFLRAAGHTISLHESVQPFLVRHGYARDCATLRCRDCDEKRSLSAWATFSSHATPCSRR